MVRTDNLTILIVDMVGFTERTARLSRAQNRALLRRFHRLLRPLARRFHGRVVKSMGDSLMITFRSPTDALHCAMAMHDRCALHNADAPEQERINLRAALNLGEVRVERSDLFGEPVNITARIEALTPPDEIWFSEAVYLAMNKAEVPAEPVGEHRLKGIPEPVRIYRVPPGTAHRLVPAGDAQDAAGSPSELPYGGTWLEAEDLRPGTIPRLLARAVGPLEHRLPVIAAAAGTLLVALGAAWWIHDSPTERTAQAETAEAGESGQVAQEAAPEAVVDPQQQARARELLEQGHALYAQRLRGEAIGLYERALGMDPSLRDDPQLVANLVEALGRVTRLAEPLIRRYPSDALLAELARRSGEPGPYGRAAATRLLRDLGRPDLIDHVGAALVALREAQDCESRLSAIKRIRQLGDPRALPAVREQISGGFGQWLSNRCLWDYAKETARELERKAAPDKQG